MLAKYCADASVSGSKILAKSTLVFTAEWFHMALGPFCAVAAPVEEQDKHCAIIRQIHNFILINRKNRTNCGPWNGSTIIICCTFGRLRGWAAYRAPAKNCA